MLVEQYTHVDALDMTWVRFMGCVQTFPTLRRVLLGKPMDRKEEIQQQKEQQEYEL
jgi:hypothetical protein